MYDNPHFIDEEAGSEDSDNVPTWQNQYVSDPNASWQGLLHCFLRVSHLLLLSLQTDSLLYMCELGRTHVG